MTFGEWLREGSERYLLDAARQEVSARYGARAVVFHDRGAMAQFWRRVFVPTYRLLPWRLRLRVIQAMPGSHRRRWAPAPQRHDPAV